MSSPKSRPIQSKPLFCFASVAVFSDAVQLLPDLASAAVIIDLVQLLTDGINCRDLRFCQCHRSPTLLLPLWSDSGCFAKHFAKVFAESFDGRGSSVVGSQSTKAYNT